MLHNLHVPRIVLVLCNNCRVDAQVHGAIKTAIRRTSCSDWVQD